MSYCRWSGDDYRCDVYCYHDVAGYWVVHVASARHDIDPDAFPPPLEEYDVAAYVDRHAKVMDLIRDAGTVPIGLPYDGKSYTEPSAEAAARRLEKIRDAGYNVPDYAIEALYDTPETTP